MKQTIEIKTDKLFTIITPTVERYAREWGKSGIVHIYTTHTTTSQKQCSIYVLFTKYIYIFFLQACVLIRDNPADASLGAFLLFCVRHMPRRRNHGNSPGFDWREHSNIQKTILVDTKL